MSYARAAEGLIGRGFDDQAIGLYRAATDDLMIDERLRQDPGQAEERRRSCSAAVTIKMV